MIVMAGVLVLDNSFRPLRRATVEEAVEHIVKNKAFPLAGATIIATYRSPSTTIQVPSILVLKAYVPIPKKLSRHITNALLFARDDFTCQYCGRHVSELPMVRDRRRGKSHKSGKNAKMSKRMRAMKLTRDHIKPQSMFSNRGEANKWDNVTTACEECNNKKANMLPYQCGMYPIKTPVRPQAVLITVYDKLNDEQRSFVDAYIKGDLSAFLVRQ
jgi:5-methylcytosine-specific restriction endonuclease McrA